MLKVFPTVHSRDGRSDIRTPSIELRYLRGQSLEEFHASEALRKIIEISVRNGTVANLLITPIGDDYSVSVGIIGNESSAKNLTNELSGHLSLLCFNLEESGEELV
jgi:hypothetical protein